jgi:hypothetical protein
VARRTRAATSRSEQARYAAAVQPIESAARKAIREASRAERRDGYLAALVQMETAIYAGVSPFVWLRDALAAVQEDEHGRA